MRVPFSVWLRPWCRKSFEGHLSGLLLMSLTALCSAQDSDWKSLPKFEIPPSDIELSRDARPNRYLGVIGREAAWLGSETGEAEIWVHPLKVAKDFQLEFRTPQYPEAIPGKDLATRIFQRPEITTIVYSHATFTVRQHILVPLEAPGVLVLLDVQCIQPMEIVVKFQSVLQYAWPGALGGQYVSWNSEEKAFVLSESQRRHNAWIGSPLATIGSSHPAHALPDALSQMVIPLEPEGVRTDLVPIVIAAGIVSRQEVRSRYHRLLEQARMHYLDRRDLYEQLRESGVRLRTPDERINLALEWARVNLEEQRVSNPDLGTGLVAGWGRSGNGFRPGFGWFFGGDAAINMGGMSALGAFEGVAEGLRFLARYQRSDGKIPHEISQSAKRIPWFTDFPYAYYHADTTPHWLAALGEYFQATGDRRTLSELWPAARKAFQWCLSVESDGDGIIENTAGGLGAVEVGELGKDIHQDIYLAAVWLKALAGFTVLAAAMEEHELAERAGELFARGSRTLNDGYWLEDAGFFAFGILAGGGKNDSLTVWPAAAAATGLLDPARARRTLFSLASAGLTSDWGCRMLDSSNTLYDPIHYNMGAVWPFVSGFAAVGHYRYGRPWAGFPLIQALASLGLDWSPGRFPELLSGRFYRPLDEAVPHQFFSASPLPSTLVTGLLGFAPDAPSGRIRISPQLPAEWEKLRVENLAVGPTRLNLGFRQEENSLEIQFETSGPSLSVELDFWLPPGASNITCTAGTMGVSQQLTADGDRLLAHFDSGTLSSPVRLSWIGGLRLASFPVSLQAGQESHNPRILDFGYREGKWFLVVEGLSGTETDLTLVGEPVEVVGEEIAQRNGGSTRLRVKFPAGKSGFVRRTLSVRRSPTK